MERRPRSYPRFLEEEKSLVPKTGQLEDCEDRIYLGKHFAAVIDGVTSKTARRWNGKTGGLVAADFICRAFQQMSADCAARQAVQLMTRMIADHYVNLDVIEKVRKHPVERMAASFVAVSMMRREIWLVGDCQYILNQQSFSNPKKIDRLLSRLRSLFLSLELLKGKTIEELRRKDTGRQFIMPLLLSATVFQNNPQAGEFWYPVVDGFPIPEQGILVRPIPDNADSIVLASDGYPFLTNDLGQAEAALNDLLQRDPLLISEYKSTKGMVNGFLSFDDRVFLKLRILPKSH